MPDITEMRISEMTAAATLDESDLFETSQADAGSQTGYITKKTTLGAIAAKSVKGINFTSDLQTTAKTIIGAINEVKGNVGSQELSGLDDVDITTPADGECLQYNGTSQKWENKDILAVNETTLTEPYVYKQVPNGKYTEKLKKLIGASVVHNQLCKKFTTRSSGNITATVDTDGKVTFSGTSTGNFAFAFIGSADNTQVVSGHKYLINLGNLTADKNAYFTFRISNGEIFTAVNIKETHNESIVVNATESGTATLALAGAVNITTVSGSVYPMLIDLTALFGNSAIADYVYSLEQNQAGSGIAWLKSYGFFTEDYYAYSENTIQSVSVSKHITIDSENQTLTETALDHTEQRGIFYLDNGELKVSGDIYNADGSGSVNYAEVDLGSLTWSYTTESYSYFVGTIQGIQTDTLSICEKYEQVTGSWSAVTNGKYRIGTDAIRIVDNNYTDAATFKTAMSGKKLVYKKATPTTAALTPFNELSALEQGGTEEFVDYGVEQGNRDVAIPVGNESVYGDNRLMAQIIKYINN